MKNKLSQRHKPKFREPAKIRIMFEGKKTFIGIALMLGAFLLTRYTPATVSKDELEVLYEDGEKIVTVVKDSVWPQIQAFIGAVLAIYGRIKAKKVYGEDVPKGIPVK